MVVFSFRLTSELVRSCSVPARKRRNGFAFERQPSVSLLTSGKAKNLRAQHEYPSFTAIIRWSFFFFFWPQNCGFSPSSRHRMARIWFAYHAQNASRLLVSGKRRYLLKEYHSSVAKRRKTPLRSFFCFVGEIEFQNLNIDFVRV